MPCAVCGLPGPSDAAHVVSRGAGGDRRVQVPLCRACHRLQHAEGWSAVEREHGVSRVVLLAVAARLSAEWEAGLTDAEWIEEAYGVVPQDSSSA